MRKITSVVLVATFTWCFAYVYHLVIGVSTITEFIVVFITIGLLLNGIYFAWSIASIKRKFTKKNKEYNDRMIEENPDCEETRILYGKN